MRSPAVRRAFTHRVTALAAELPGALQDDVEALHRSRVASRRLREILAVLDLQEAAAGGRPIRNRIRRLTRALGGVRELDVVLGLLDDLADHHPDIASVVDVVRGRVLEERADLRTEMSARLTELDATTLPDELRSLESVFGGQPRAARRATLARRLNRRARRLGEAIEQAGLMYAPERLHAVRIAAKQLRYVLELVQEFGGVGTRRLTARVKRFQNLLGRLHDLEIVCDRVRRYGCTGSDRGAESARLLEVIDRDLRELHAKYLANLGTLREVVEACRTRVEPRLDIFHGLEPGPGRGR